MSQRLHILTKPDDSLAEKIIAAQRQQGDAEIIVRDLTGAKPDYEKLLQEIFRADSIQVW